MSVKQKTRFRLIKRLVLMAFLLLVGLGGRGLALTPEAPLQVEGDLLTGHLSQVPLRTVLEQLQKQLGIAYEVPEGELDKVISVDLHQAPILPALAKILAPWDYAFTADAAGHLQFLYVTPKAPTADAVSDTSESSDVMPSNAVAEKEFNSFKQNRPERRAGYAERSLSHEHEPDQILPSSSGFSSPPGEISGFKAPVAGGPMAIQPVPEGTTMPMMPGNGGSGMQITPPANPPNMPIIPATAYPPMDIQPVPDYLKEEMLRNIQP